CSATVTPRSSSRWKCTTPTSRSPGCAPASSTWPSPTTRAPTPSGASRPTMADFSSEPWMLATGRTCPDARLFLRACHDAGFEPRIAFQNDDYGAILGFVAAGVGVALVPDMATRAVRGDVVIRELDPAPPSRPISVILPSGYRSPAAAAMLEVLRDVGQAWVAARPALAERTGAVSV